MYFLPPRWNPGFLLFSVAALVWGPEVACGQKFRIAAANITSGNGQDYDGGHGIRILQGIKPDIVLIQEFNYLNNTSSDLRAFVDLTFGSGFAYYREGGGGAIPNGIISRFPILESGEWPSPVAERDFAWARIDLPGNRELLAVSVHLPTTASQRPGEAQELVSYIKSYYTANGGSRATDYLVVGGDFNTASRTESCLDLLGEVVTIGTVHPADQNGQVNTNANRNRPYDAVYAGKGMHTLQVPTVITRNTAPATFSTYLHGLVVDTRVYTPLAEIAPALISDSGATNMQHMAVVKDYEIALPQDPPVLEWLSSTYSASPPRMILTFKATPGATYDLQATTNPSAGSWNTLASVTAVASTTTFRVVQSGASAGEVTDASLGQSLGRFYRIRRK